VCRDALYDMLCVVWVGRILMVYHRMSKDVLFCALTLFTENYLSLIFRKINDFVHRFILDHKSVDFTILVVNSTILYC
jgi:hypothetical protein